MHPVLEYFINETLAVSGHTRAKFTICLLGRCDFDFGAFAPYFVGFTIKKCQNFVRKPFVTHGARAIRICDNPRGLDLIINH